MSLTTLLRVLLAPPWRSDLEQQLDQLGQVPVPEPDPACIARLDAHIAACRTRLTLIRGDLDQLQQDAR